MSLRNMMMMLGLSVTMTYPQTLILPTDAMDVQQRVQQIQLANGEFPGVFPLTQTQLIRLSTISGAESIAALLKRYRTSDQVHLRWPLINPFKDQDKRSPIIYYQDGERELYLDITAQLEQLLEADASLSIVRGRYQLGGKITSNLSFYTALDELFTIGDESAMRQRSRSLRTGYNRRTLTDEKTSADYQISYLHYQMTDSTSVTFGKIPWHIGLSRSGSLFMNTTVSIPSLALQTAFWRFRYTSIHGQVSASYMAVIDDALQLQSFPDKYIATHRFEFLAMPTLLLHYTEMIAYGNRSADWSYIVPFALFRAQEHEQGDRDNVMIGFGFAWQPVTHWTIFTDILLDEWKISKFGTDWFGNKHALQMGAHFTTNQWHVAMEATFIRPFVYSHKADWNSWTSDDQLIGFPAGPNSQTFYVGADYHPEIEWTLHGSLSVIDKGENESVDPNRSWNVGGDAFIGHRNDNIGGVPSVAEHIPFLSGDRRQTIRIRLGAEYHPGPHASTRFEMVHENIDGLYARLTIQITL